jgi:hypothetical protein
VAAILPGETPDTASQDLDPAVFRAFAAKKRLKVSQGRQIYFHAPLYMSLVSPYKTSRVARQ